MPLGNLSCTYITLGWPNLVQFLSWSSNSSRIWLKQKFITFTKKASHCSPILMQIQPFATPAYLISLLSNLILSSHLQLDHLSGHFYVSPPKLCIPFFSSPTPLTFVRSHSSLYKGKVKAIPLQAWNGPEGSRRLKLPDFKTIGTLRW